MTLNIYKDVLTQKKEQLKKKMAEVPLSAVEDKARLCLPTRNFVKKIKEDIKNHNYAWVMDIKRANIYGETFFDKTSTYNPDSIAEKAASAGASCISVTTDNIFCGGDNFDFTRVREAISLPMLRKDFIISNYQVIESRALEADCIPLHLTLLDDTQARIIEQTALQWGMDVMIVVHNEYEIERALSHLHSRFIALDNRELIKGKVNLDNTRNLIKHLPKGYLGIAMTGIKQSRTIQSYQESGIQAFMIGETLQKQANLYKVADKLFPEE